MKKIKEKSSLRILVKVESLPLRKEQAVIVRETSESKEFQSLVVKGRN